MPVGNDIHIHGTMGGGGVTAPRTPTELLADEVTGTCERERNRGQPDRRFKAPNKCAISAASLSQKTECAEAVTTSS
jgi:hypothetical protein